MYAMLHSGINLLYTAQNRK